MLATVRARSACIDRLRQSRSARPVRSRKTSSSVARRIGEVLRLEPAGLGQRQQRPDRRPDVARVEQDLAVVLLDRGHARQARHVRRLYPLEVVRTGRRAR